MEHFMYGVICVESDPEIGKPACNNGRPIELSEQEYMRQLSVAHKPWHCPKCGGEAVWDDNSLCMGGEDIP